MKDLDTQVIVSGAGVVGLAIARELALADIKTILVERNQLFGAETSSRNSEVIHAGIYYPQNSLKAKLCVQGKELLYKYALARNISHRRCGKLIVATDHSQLSRLAEIHQQAQLNDVLDLINLNSSQSKQLEPNVDCSEALLSPSTGIIDSHQLMVSLLGDFEDAGGIYCHSHNVVKVDCSNNNVPFSVTLCANNEQFDLSCEGFVNSTGLSAVRLASCIIGLDQKFVPEEIFAKGSYFTYSEKKVFTRHIYPIPEDGGLGIHATVANDGSTKFGPDVSWYTDYNDYSVNESSRELFYKSIRRYFPDIKVSGLNPDYSGIRPKLSHKGEKPKDFMIQLEEEHGITGLVNLFGIESPGLTSSLAIGKFVSEQLVPQL